MYGFRDFIYDRGTDGSIIQMYLQNSSMKVSEIALQTGKSQAEIYRILHQYEIQPNRLKKNYDKVMDLHNNGWNIKEIAAYTGYTSRNVRYILSKIMNEGQ